MSTHQAVLIDDTIFVSGGSSGGEIFADVFKSQIQPDGTLGSWVTDTPLRERRGSHAMVFRNGHIYVTAGAPGPFPPPEGGTTTVFFSSFIIPVDIDIKPGSDPNSINTKSKGTIPVAILSGSGFDAPAEVDKDSLTFGRTGDEVSLAFCSKSPEARAREARLCRRSC